jgi:hypothetical protein
MIRKRLGRRPGSPPEKDLLRRKRFAAEVFCRVTLPRLPIRVLWRDLVEWFFVLTAAAYNLVRIQDMRRGIASILKE